MMLQKKIFKTLPLAASVLSTFAQQSIEFNHWKFKTGDNLQWAEPSVDDSAWSPIRVGENWQKQGYKNYEGYGWYRTKFQQPSSLKEQAQFKDSVRIALGNIDDCDETFLDGQLLGQNAKVIRNGGLCSMDERVIGDPCVLRYQDQWAVFYYCFDEKTVSRNRVALLSPDMRKVTKCEGALLEPGPKGSIDEDYAMKPSLICHDAVLYHFFRPFPTNMDTQSVFKHQNQLKDEFDKTPYRMRV